MRESIAVAHVRLGNHMFQAVGRNRGSARRVLREGLEKFKGGASYDIDRLVKNATVSELQHGDFMRVDVPQPPSAVQNNLGDWK